MTEYRGEEYTSWKDVEEAIRLMGLTAQTLAKAGETNLADRLEDARSIACNVSWRLENRYYAEMKRRMEEEE